MHIILVSNRLATAKTLNVTPKLAVASLATCLFLLLAMSLAFSWIGVRFNLPFAAELVDAAQQMHNRKNEEYMRDNIKSMAIKLGEMQAQVMRLDLLGERVSKHTGISVPKNEGGAKGGQGGPLINPSKPLSLNELEREVDRLAGVVEARNEAMTALESQLMERRIKVTLLPTMQPVGASHIGSTFGRRVDPIEGVGAMHEGIDFVADVGTRVVASAGGVVVTNEYHPQYGNLIEIDHGNDFSSRYAHLSRSEVKVGQIIKRGQEIARTGNTGRSTGPHLHFEVRFKGAAQNPTRFLEMGNQMALNEQAAAQGVAPGKAGPLARRAPAEAAAAN